MFFIRVYTIPTESKKELASSLITVEQMANYKHIFWDWNGTLFDDTDACIKSMNLLLEKRKLTALDRDGYAKIFGFPVIDYYRKAGFDFEKDPYEKLAHEYMKNYGEESKKAGLNGQARAVLKRLSAAGFKQYVLSASENLALNAQLKEHNVAEFFTAIIGCNDIFAKGKIAAALAWLDKNPLDGKAVLIGDTVHDFEVANALSFDCILFSGGHGEKSALLKTGARVFNSLEDVADFLLIHI